MSFWSCSAGTGPASHFLPIKHLRRGPSPPSTTVVVGPRAGCDGHASLTLARAQAAPFYLRLHQRPRGRSGGHAGAHHLGVHSSDLSSRKEQHVTEDFLGHREEGKGKGIMRLRPDRGPLKRCMSGRAVFNMTICLFQERPPLLAPSQTEQAETGKQRKQQQKSGGLVPWKQWRRGGALGRRVIH